MDGWFNLWMYAYVYTVFSIFVALGDSLICRPLFGLLHQPRMMDDDERGAVCGMIGKGNRSTLRKPVPMPLCPMHLCPYV
jgi:hypothetical protein